jgi:uncharacterized protein (TIGR04222 family)
MSRSTYLVDSSQIELFERIQEFSLDQVGAQLPFSRRLARENGWSIQYTQRVIEEYKRFAFIAVTAGHPVTPSMQVDKVWHMHLTYTRSYWETFCPNVLHMPLHHEPTRGGKAEQLKFGDWYSTTLESYERFFGAAPPSDIWPNPKSEQNSNALRAVIQQIWAVPKLILDFYAKRQHPIGLPVLLLTLTLTLAGCQAVSSFSNPLNFTGPDFLAFYIPTACVVIFLALGLRSILLLEDKGLTKQPVDLDVYESAYLAVGASRVAETAIAHLVQSGHVAAISEKRKLVLEKPVESSCHLIEKVVADAIESDGDISNINRAVTRATDEMKNQLQRFGLLMSPSQLFKAKFFSALMIAVLLALGVFKIFVGISHNKPVGYLFLLCFLISVIGLCFLLITPHRTRYGNRILEELRTKLSHSTTFSHTNPELSLAVALLGTTVLIDSEFSGLKQILTPSNSGGDFNVDGGGCGSGCGGGCGGCGG